MGAFFSVGEEGGVEGSRGGGGGSLERKGGGESRGRGARRRTITAVVCRRGGEGWNMRAWSLC